MSFGDDTLTPESAEERELRELRAELSAIRREVGADERCVYNLGKLGECWSVAISDDVRKALHTERCVETCLVTTMQCGHHFYQPESILAAVQRMARERTYLKQLYDAEFYNRDTVGQMYQKLAMALHCIAAGAGSTPDGERAIAALQAAEKLKMDRVTGAPKVGQARGTAKDHSSTNV